MKTIPLEDALTLFSNWKEGSIKVRASLSAGRMLPGDAPFVSAIITDVEGTVALVDPPAYVSIDGNGCKIGLDLHECGIKGKKTTDPPARGNPAHAANYDWHLAITFPSGEYCSVTSYARANWNYEARTCLGWAHSPRHQLNKAIATDLAARELTSETAGLEEFFQAVENLYQRLANLLEDHDA